MSRYIDADKLIQEIKDAKEDYYGSPTEVDRHDEKCNYAISLISDALISDSVEIVRCKDCKHWLNDPDIGTTEHVKFCSLGYYMTHETGYCVYGDSNVTHE